MDYSRQVGPRDHRPACVLFKEWVVTSLSLGLDRQDAADEPHTPVSRTSSGLLSRTISGAGGVLESQASVTMNELFAADVSFEPSLPVLPLPLFQPNDVKQIGKLYSLVRKLPQLIHYYLRQHVFPTTMNFQSLKVSACGHELGSSILFGKRVGFSGTPSQVSLY